MALIAIKADSGNFEEVVLRSPDPVVVYFYSDDCLPCRTFDGIFDRVGSSMHGTMRFVKVFRPHNRQLAEHYSVKSSPTLMFFKEGAEVCERLTGYVNYPEFRSAVEKIQVSACPPRQRGVVRCDVLVLGAGPAGLTAAIYAARSKLYAVVVDPGIIGGQAASTYSVSNYPGTNGIISGLDLTENMKKQALDFGAQIDDMQEIQEVKLGSVNFIKTTDCDYYAKSVIIAAGSEPRKLPVPNEREFRGRGIHYCATCDGALYHDTDLIVVGGGASALEEAVFLTRYARNVIIVNRSDAFKAAQSSIDEAMKSPQIEVVFNTTVREVKGVGFVEGAVLENVKTGETTEVKVEGVFVYIGSLPNTSMFAPYINLTERGFIPTDESMATNIPGVFAAGDIREKRVRQISTAVGDGTIAGVMAERYINNK